MVRGVWTAVDWSRLRRRPVRWREKDRKFKDGFGADSGPRFASVRKGEGVKGDGAVTKGTIARERSMLQAIELHRRNTGADPASSHRLIKEYLTGEHPK